MESFGRVLVAEDDPAVRAAITTYLEHYGFDVDAHDNGVSAHRAFMLRTPDVLVLDRMLPGMSGDELSRVVRDAGPTPILMLTALAAVDDRVEGLELGVDDYLTKPFSLKELTLRIRALLRRTSAAQHRPGIFAVGEFLVDPAHRRVWIAQREISLTSREYELLLCFTQYPDETITRDTLMREIWGWKFGDSSTVTVHVKRLREKIEPDPADPRYLRTEWGAGYRFTPNGDAR